jgi:hypothetical protein
VNVRMDPLNKKRLFNFLDSMGFRDLSRRMKNQFKNAAAGTVSIQETSQNEQIADGKLSSVTSQPFAAVNEIPF